MLTNKTTIETILVGIGGIAISNTPGKSIKTLALGSCVGVLIYCPHLKIAGLVHVALPASKIFEEKSKKLPGYFADTGVRELIKEFKNRGVKAPGELVVKMVGGANVMDPDNVFNIGKRNALSVKKNLWKNKLSLSGEDIGGAHSRTVWIEVDTGSVFISTPGRSLKEV